MTTKKSCRLLLPPLLHLPVPLQVKKSWSRSGAGFSCEAARQPQGYNKRCSVPQQRPASNCTLLAAHRWLAVPTLLFTCALIVPAPPNPLQMAGLRVGT